MAHSIAGKVAICMMMLLTPLAYAADGRPLMVEWDKASPVILHGKAMKYSSAVQEEQGQKVLCVTATAVPGVKSDGVTASIAMTCMPIGAVDADSSGISFEYKGDGSRHYASVFVGENDSLFNAHEAIFPLDSVKWQTMTLRWRDLVKNDIPWGQIPARLSESEVSPSPEKLKYIGFGRGCCFHKFYTPEFGFSVRNIRIVTDLPDKPIARFSKGFSRTRELLRQRKPVNILLLGDSITDIGGDKSHGYYCAQLMKKQWGVNSRVVNAGIGGQTVRGGTILLPQSLRFMPNADLVCIFYGANDCKAVDGKTGFSEKVFAMNLETLIDQVRQRTRGRADIVLLSGVPRLDKEWMTTGAVEKIVNAVKTVAHKKETAFCDTFRVFLPLSVAQKKIYYRDSIHQRQEGLEFIGQLLFKTMLSDVSGR